MSKYYRVRTQEQWEWLMDKLEENSEIKWLEGAKPTTEAKNKFTSYGTPTAVMLNNDNTLEYSSYDFYISFPEYEVEQVDDFIEVSQMMEGEKMKDYVEIKGEDLKNVEMFNNYGSKRIIGSFWDVNKVTIPKSLLYPKIQFTLAEKAEFDSIDNDETLYNALDAIKLQQCPHLYERLYERTSASIPELELEFARAWADPSLIEVHEQKWNVRVPAVDNPTYYYKTDDGIGICRPSPTLESLRTRFTAEELKHYGLDNDLFEKVEVSE